MKKYDAWGMLDSIFGTYRLKKLRKDFWKMYKSAMLDTSTYQTKKQRSDLISLFSLMTSLTTATYILAFEKGLEVYKASPLKAFFPLWQRFEKDPWDVLLDIFSGRHLDDIREALWTMYQAAVQNESIYDDSEEREELVDLFERLTDLATAAHVVTKEKFEQIQSGKPTTQSYAKNS